MESQPQNPEFRNNLENFHPCKWRIFHDNSCFINLLNKLRRREKTQGLLSILLLFRNKFNKFNKTGAPMLDSIYHMRSKLP